MTKQVEPRYKIIVHYYERWKNHDPHTDNPVEVNREFPFAPLAQYLSDLLIRTGANRLVAEGPECKRSGATIYFSDRDALSGSERRTIAGFVTALKRFGRVQESHIGNGRAHHNLLRRMQNEEDTLEALM